MKQPKTFADLFAFYNDYVRLLYAAIQAENELPQETLFEINAAFDHLARHWTHGHTEAEEVAKAFSHLKRSCLDVFKLKVKDTRDKYDALSRIDTSIIDNGRFDKEMHQLIADVKAKSIEARRADAAEHDGYEHSFALWVDAYELCDRFIREFYLNDNVEWARRINRGFGVKAFVLAILASVVGGLVVGPWFWNLFKMFWEHFGSSYVK